MATPKVYTRKQDAARAAKKEFGEGWKETVEIFERDGGFVYDFPRKEAKEVATAVLNSVSELLAQNAADIKEKAVKAKKIKAGKPVHIPATDKSGSDQGQDHPKAPEKSDDGHIKGFDAETASSPEGLVEERPGVFTNAAADALANQQATSVDPLKPRVSIVERPTKLVWDIADNMPEAKRSEVIAACVQKGIAYGTARTQYQHWFKQKAVSAVEPRASLDGNGKIIPATKA